MLTRNKLNLREAVRLDKIVLDELILAGGVLEVGSGLVFALGIGQARWRSAETRSVARP
jgi:hypothetical protein